MFVKSLAPVLPEAENIALLMEAKNGNDEAKEKFFAHNMKLMVYKANQFLNTGFEFEDLFSATQFGFFKAFNSFDPSREVKFATYSSRCMENEILMFVQKNKRHRKGVHLEFHMATGDEGEVITPMDIIPCPHPSSLAIEDKDALRQALAVFKKKTSERNCMVLTLRFEHELGQYDIAKRLGISQSYVSRLETQMLDKIRQIKERQAR